MQLIASENGVVGSCQALEMSVSNIIRRLKGKWEKSYRNYARFLQVRRACCFALPTDCFAPSEPSSSSESEAATPGRPTKLFEVMLDTKNGGIGHMRIIFQSRQRNHTSKSGSEGKWIFLLICQNKQPGNSVRRYFRNPDLTAYNYWRDVRLISPFLVIIEALSCDLEIDAEKPKVHIIETKNLYQSLYPWYYMPASIP